MYIFPYSYEIQYCHALKKMSHLNLFCQMNHCGNLLTMSLLCMV
jgi:hypothetical protein